MYSPFPDGLKARLYSGLGWSPGSLNKLLKPISCNLLDSLLTSAVSSPKGRSSGDVSWAQLRLKLRIRLCVPATPQHTNTSPHQHRVSTRLCAKPLKQKWAVFNLSQAWAGGWKSPSEQVRCEGKTEQREGTALYEGPRGSGSGAMLLPSWGSGEGKGWFCSMWACFWACAYVVFNATSFLGLVLAEKWSLAVYRLYTNADVRKS